MVNYCLTEIHFVRELMYRMFCSVFRGHLLRLQRGEKQFLPTDIFNRNPDSITVRGNGRAAIDF